MRSFSHFMLKSTLVLVLLASAVCTVFSDCTTNITIGQIYLKLDSRLPTYIVSAWELTDGISVSGSQLALGYNHRVYFTGQCVYNFAPLIYKPLFVLGQTLQYTVDVSRVSCGCKASLYLVSMPAYGQNQHPTPTHCDDYYCDALGLCGSFCPEMDLIEANRAALAVTPHKCSSPQGKFFSSCDGSGCSHNTKFFDGVYGPSSAYKINTMNPYKVAHKFQTVSPGGRLTHIITTLSQNGNSFTMVHDSNTCGQEYIAAMSDSFYRGMVLVSSYWSSNDGNAMSWDIPPCDPNESCDKSGVVYFSDISLGY